MARATGPPDPLAQLADDLGVVRLPEDGGTGDERVRACPRDRLDVVRLHAPVDLQPHLAAALVDAPPDLRQLGQRAGYELLATEPGIHRHDQHQVDVVERVVEPVQRRGRIEHQARPAAHFTDQADGAVDVPARLGMKADPVRAGFGEIRNDSVDRLDHEVDIDRRLHPVLAQRLADQRPDGQVRHVVVVHHVEVHGVRACGEHRFDFGTQAREVGGQDGRGDPGCLSGHVRKSTRTTLRPGPGAGAATRSLPLSPACVASHARASIQAGRLP